MSKRASVEPKEVAMRIRRMASAAPKMMTNAAVDIDQGYQFASVSIDCTTVCAKILE